MILVGVSVVSSFNFQLSLEAAITIVRLVEDFKAAFLPPRFTPSITLVSTLLALLQDVDV